MNDKKGLNDLRRKQSKMTSTVIKWQIRKYRFLQNIKVIKSKNMNISN